jgi:hypothetical protein
MVFQEKGFKIPNALEHKIAIKLKENEIYENYCIEIFKKEIELDESFEFKNDSFFELAKIYLNGTNKNFNKSQEYLEQCILLKLILYDTTNKKSFKNAEPIPETIYKIKDLTLTEIFPMLLVGTKNDLVDLRQVSYDRGTELAEHFNTNFFETSSKTPKNCDEVFLSLLKKMELFKNKKEKTQSTCITM